MDLLQREKVGECSNTMARKIDVLFQGMGEENVRGTWMKHYSILVDCVYAAVNFISYICDAAPKQLGALYQCTAWWQKNSYLSCIYIIS